MHNKGKLVSTTAKSSSKNLRNDLHRTRFCIPKENYVKEAVEKAVEILKTKEEYKHLDDDLLMDIAAAQICKYNAVSTQGKMKGFTLNDNVADGIWSNFTYEEIIQMYEAGEDVPKEVADWAYKMANYDQLSYEVDDNATDNQNDINALENNSDTRFSDQKNNLIKAASLLEKQDDKIEEDNKELEAKSKAISNKQQEMANREKSGNEKIEIYSREFNEIERKISSGENLSDDEIARYKALGSMLNSEHKEIVIQSQNVEADIANLFEDMQKSTKTAAVSSQLANEVQLLSESVAPQEKNAKAAIKLKRVVEIDSSMNNFRSAVSDGKLFNLSMDMSVNNSFLIDKSNYEVNKAEDSMQIAEKQLDTVSAYDKVNPQESVSSEVSNEDENKNTEENNTIAENNEIKQENDLSDKQISETDADNDNTNINQQEANTADVALTGAAADMEEEPEEITDVSVVDEFVENEPESDELITIENEDVPSDEFEKDNLDKDDLEDKSPIENNIISSDESEDNIEPEENINIQKRNSSRIAEDNPQPTIDMNLADEDKAEAKDKNLPASEQITDDTQNPQNVIFDEAMSDADTSIGNLSAVTDVLGDAHINNLADMPLSGKSAMTSISQSENISTPSGAVRTTKTSPKPQTQASKMEDAGDIVSPPIKDKVEDAPITKAEGKTAETQEIIANATIADAINKERKAGEEQSENNKNVIENTYNLRGSARKINDFKDDDHVENRKLSDIDKSSEIVKSDIEDNAAKQTSAPIEKDSTLNQIHERKLAKLETDNKDAKVLDDKVEYSGEQINKLGNNSDEENAKVLSQASADRDIADEKRAASRVNSDNEQKLSDKLDEINEIYATTKSVGREVKQNTLTGSVGNVLFEAGLDGEKASANSNEEIKLAEENLSDVSQDINNVRRSIDELDDRSSFVGDNVERKQNAGKGSNHIAENSYIAAKATTTPETGIDVENPEFATDIGVIDDAGAIPTVADETIDVQQVVSPEISISDNDINLVDVPNSVEEKDEMPAAQEDIKASIDDATTEAYTNPLIRDNRDAIYDEADAAIREEMKVVASVDAAKTSSKAVVKDDVAEIMQSALSSVGVRAQRKDSDNDKKHKLFTQFENQKRNEARKTVQKVNKARDAR